MAARSPSRSPEPSGIQKKEDSSSSQHNLTQTLESKLQISDEKATVSTKQQKRKEKKSKDPEGGFDKTPVPTASDGYTVRFTFIRADNLPISDINSLSTDAYIQATLTSALRKRHKEDPELVLRTPTVHRKTDPAWQYSWTVAGIPSSGFKLKCRLYDEDPSDHDDRLGNVTVHVTGLSENWEGVKEKEYEVKKRMGSKRGYLLRGCVSLFNHNMHLGGKLWLSMECCGKSEEPYGRMYTIADTQWTKHFSPMIGRLVGTKAPEGTEDGSRHDENKAEKYEYVYLYSYCVKQIADDPSFQANEFQLVGPVPAELYHRFVEFKPFVRGMFSKRGPRGRILNRALHHQHAQVYNFNNKTEWGYVPPKSKEASLQFLRMVHFDEGGRIFTYVLTLDGLLRFTETGKEFSIDLLSKHTMHSNVAVYIACSGEFFIRRLKHPHRSAESPEQKTHPDEDIPGGPPNSSPPTDPAYYELVIDNDSGTYRPDASVLPLLKDFLNENFPGLHIVTKTCDDKDLEKMKKQQVARKKKEGKNIQMVQDSDGEISSSDESDLDRTGGGKKSRKGQAYEALEDPRGVLKRFRGGDKDREEKEGEDDEALVGQGAEKSGKGKENQQPSVEDEKQ